MKTLLLSLVASIFGLGFSIVQVFNSAPGFDTWFWLAMIFIYTALVDVVFKAMR